MEKEKIRALISLLDDPDERIFEQIRQQLLSMGKDVIPHLESVWETNPLGDMHQKRLENLIHHIQFDNIQVAMAEWAASEEQDLLTGAVLVSKYMFPDFNEVKFYRFLEQIQQDIWIELSYNATPQQKVKTINHTLFEVYGFSGNSRNYHHPDNFCINKVLESKKGSPIALSVLYTVLAQNLELPIFGVNLPKHFVLAYMNRNVFLSDDNYKARKVLFYINPFSKGEIFGKEELMGFLNKLGVEHKSAFFNPCNNVAVIQRMLSSLQHSLEQLKRADKVKELKHLSDIIGGA